MPYHSTPCITRLHTECKDVACRCFCHDKARAVANGQLLACVCGATCANTAQKRVRFTKRHKDCLAQVAERKKYAVQLAATIRCVEPTTYEAHEAARAERKLVSLNPKDQTHHA